MRHDRSLADRRRRVGTAAVILVVAAVVAGDALGCPNCKDAFDASDPDGLNVARGYFYSILLMLAMPFTLAGSFGAYVWREMRRQRTQRSGVVHDSTDAPGRNAP